jgi:hypothetical protein
MFLRAFRRRCLLEHNRRRPRPHDEAALTRHARCGYSQIFTGKTGALVPRHEGGGIVSVSDLYRRTIRAEVALAMTIRIIPILAVAVMIEPSLAYTSPACMTKNEARAKFPKETIYSHQHCWNDSAAALVHSPRPALAAVPVPSPRPALAAEPVPSSRPKIISSGIDVTAAQCQYSPCE